MARLSLGPCQPDHRPRCTSNGLQHPAAPFRPVCSVWIPNLSVAAFATNTTWCVYLCIYLGIVVIPTLASEHLGSCLDQTCLFFKIQTDPDMEMKETKRNEEQNKISSPRILLIRTPYCAPCFALISDSPRPKFRPLSRHLSHIHAFRLCPSATCCPPPLHLTLLTSRHAADSSPHTATDNDDNASSPPLSQAQYVGDLQYPPMTFVGHC